MQLTSSKFFKISLAGKLNDLESNGKLLLTALLCMHKNIKWIPLELGEA